VSAPGPAKTAQLMQSSTADAPKAAPAAPDYARLLRLLDSQVEQHLNLQSGHGAAGRRANPARPIAADLTPARAPTIPVEPVGDAAPPVGPVLQAAPPRPHGPARRTTPLTTVLTATLCSAAALGIGWALERAVDGAWQRGAPAATTASNDVLAQPATVPALTGLAASSASAPSPPSPSEPTHKPCAAAATALALCQPSTQ
jgi:hypothetical protein